MSLSSRALKTQTNAGCESVLGIFPRRPAIRRTNAGVNIQWESRRTVKWRVKPAQRARDLEVLSLDLSRTALRYEMKTIAT